MSIPQAKKQYRPRLSEEITEEQSFALRDLIPYGIRKPIMSLIIDSLIDLLRKGNPNDILGLLLTGHIVIEFKFKDVEEGK
jgi:hypothetical protein